MLARFFVCTLLCMTAGSSAAISDDRSDLARKLIEVTQAEMLSQQFLDAFMPQIMGLALQSDPDLSDEKKARISNVVKQEIDAAMPEVINLNVTTFAKHFTAEELQDALDFHQSPTGRKFQSVTPQLVQEVLQGSQPIGERVGTSIVERLRAEGDL